MNMVAVRTDDLGLESFGLAVEGVELVVLANVDLPDDSTFDKKRETAVQSSPGYGLVQVLGIPKQLFDRKVTGLSKEGLDYPLSLVGHAQALARQEVGKTFPCLLVGITHWAK